MIVSMLFSLVISAKSMMRRFLRLDFQLPITHGRSKQIRVSIGGFWMRLSINRLSGKSTRAALIYTPYVSLLKQADESELYRYVVL